MLATPATQSRIAAEPQPRPESDRLTPEQPAALTSEQPAALTWVLCEGWEKIDIATVTMKEVQGELSDEAFEKLVAQAQLFPEEGVNVWVFVIKGFASKDEVAVARKEALREPTLEFSGGFGGECRHRHTRQCLRCGLRSTCYGQGSPTSTTSASASSPHSPRSTPLPAPRLRTPRHRAQSVAPSR